MIHLSNFDTDFKGRKFQDASHGASPTYTAVGYGDNDANGNPYIVGMTDDGGSIRIKTILFKNVHFVP